MVADSDATVLILGESGTGKELLARAVHERSGRRGKAFIPVNCGAVAESLQESEFFGHLPGAFTGAHQRKIGRFEAADGGTLFLDEVSEMRKSLQAQLLRVLQSGEYAPIGMATNRTCDVRVVAASNRDLEDLVRHGRFREDLYYRLNVISLEVPALRDRRGDIPLLVNHFLRIFGDRYSKPQVSVAPETMQRLKSYDFPGNVRELENLLRRCVLLARGPIITPEDLPHRLFERRADPAADPPENFHEAKAIAIERFERSFLTSLLRECSGIVSRAARKAGLSERNLHAKLKLYGISGSSFRGGCRPSRGHPGAGIGVP